MIVYNSKKTPQSHKIPLHVNGKEIISQSFDGTEAINISGYYSGIYFIESRGDNLTKKIVKLVVDH